MGISLECWVRISLTSASSTSSTSSPLSIIIDRSASLSTSRCPGIDHRVRLVHVLSTYTEMDVATCYMLESHSTDLTTATTTTNTSTTTTTTTSSTINNYYNYYCCRHDVSSRRVEGDSGAGCAGGTGNAQLFARCPERHLGVVERR
jgi:hypothetical protein